MQTNQMRTRLNRSITDPEARCFQCLEHDVRTTSVSFQINPPSTIGTNKSITKGGMMRGFNRGSGASGKNDLMSSSSYAGSDASKIAWLAFRGFDAVNVSGSLGNSLDPRSPVNAAFRTITFASRSPIRFEFDRDSGYVPDDESVFELEDDEHQEYH